MRMKKYLTVLSSFIIMLCIGGIYAWSILAAELTDSYKFSALQSQLIFGTVIAIFPLTMIFVGQLGKKINHRYLGYIAGILFLIGYLLASYSQGNFLSIFVGIGIVAGIATGFGYWVSLTSPVQWFPHKKGLITGIAAAGFGLGAVFFSELSELILNNDYDVLQLFKIIGVPYGLIIILFSNFIYQVQNKTISNEEPVKITQIIRTVIFKKLFLGIFLGTFAGLLIIGSLRIIGGQYEISNHILVMGIAIFALANFLGRLIWGLFSDYFGASISIFLALFIQSVAILMLNFLTLTDVSYLVLSFMVGFGFGGNFVLFAKETAQEFGLKNLGIIYPYVLIGYSIAGIAGPISGGILFDLSGSYSYALILASIMSILGSVLFLSQHVLKRK